MVNNTYKIKNNELKEKNPIRRVQNTICYTFLQFEERDHLHQNNQ